jgi:hypothetical protein
MLREDCRVGMRVLFGRINGEKTKGVIVKTNPKKAKIQTSEDRGSGSPAGAVWNVPYSMIYPSNGESQRDIADVPITYSVFQPRADQFILEAIVCVYTDLSPENLCCDGELPPSQVRVRFRELGDRLQHLFRAFGRPVSEKVAYDWSESKRAAAR